MATFLNDYGTVINVVLKSERNQDEQEVEDKHGEAHPLCHFPIEDED